MSFVDNLKDLCAKVKNKLTGKKEEDKQDKHYLTGKEVRAIAKENGKIMRALEKKKRRKADESEFTTQMKDNGNILEVEDLHSFFFTDQGVVKSVNGVSFNVPQGATVGVVGESGCGKSVTSLSIMQLLQGPQGQIYSGSIRFKSFDFKLGENGKPVPIWEDDENGQPIYDPVTDKKGNPKLDKNGVPVTARRQKRDEYGTKLYEMEEKVLDIAQMPIKEMYRLRGRQIAMIFQEPMTSLNPVFTIGNQLDEVTLLHVPDATKEEAKRRSIEMLNLVGIAMPERVYKSYPHELSGGMRQRVMIAMALEGNPRLIIADEPTTALDVTIQAQILDLLRDLKDKINGSILLITHDLGVIAEMADFVVVMYAGRIIEQGTASEIFHHPMHPYTIGLQKSKPTMNSEGDTLFNIPGNVPNPIDMPNYCYFRERCSGCSEQCFGDYPQMKQVSPTHWVACHLYDEKEPSDYLTETTAEAEETQEVAERVLETEKTTEAVKEVKEKKEDKEGKKTSAKPASAKAPTKRPTAAKATAGNKTEPSKSAAKKPSAKKSATGTAAKSASSKATSAKAPAKTAQKKPSQTKSVKEKSDE